MRGWQVVTGASDHWTPACASDAAIHSLLPGRSGSASGSLPQWPPVISTGVGAPLQREPSLGLHRALSTSSQRLDATPLLLGHAASGPGLLPFPTPPLFRMHQDMALDSSSAAAGTLPGIPEAFPLSAEADPMLAGLQAVQASELAAEGHSSGHSGGGHVEVAPQGQDAGKKEVSGPSSARRAPAPAGPAYHLRTRSSSLRAAWVERPVKEEEEEEEAPEAARLRVRAGGGCPSDARPVAALLAEAQAVAAADLAGVDEDEDDMDELSSASEGDAPSLPPPRKAARPGRAAGRPGKAASPKVAGGRVAKAAADRAAAKAGAPSKGDAATDADEEGVDAAQKRMGRPVVYRGDPDAPGLTDAERRKIKRRIANRESARRVRAKRAELMDELQIKVTALSQQNGQLASHAAVLESQRNMLLQQNAMLQQKLSHKSEENVVLFNQLFRLRMLLPPEVVAQAERDAAAATPPPGTPMSGMQAAPGAGMFVPVTPHARQPISNGGSGLGDDPFTADTQCLQFL